MRITSIILFLVFVVFSICTTIVHAGEMSKSILYDFGSKNGKTTSEKLTLSIDYDSDRYWIDERIVRDLSQDVSLENFLGAGWKNKVNEKFDVSVGLIWQYDDKSNYLGSFRGRYKIGDVKFIGFYQPYLNRTGYIAKGSIVHSGFVQEFEYRSENDMVTLKTGIEF